MSLRIEIDREDDGRWVAEVPDLRGVFAYGETRGEALDRVRAAALRVIAAQLEKREAVPYLAGIFSTSSAPPEVVLDPTAEDYCL